MGGPLCKAGLQVDDGGGSLLDRDLLDHCDCTDRAPKSGFLHDQATDVPSVLDGALFMD